jgi:hydroxymethylpyrimidine/phosphomethylpyrimidine kinase
MKPWCVLTIAGSDSGAGAGIQADARTVHALGGFALTAVTAVTAQNTRGIRTWRAVPPALIAAQIEAVLDDFPAGAIKTGLLPGRAVIRAVAAVLKKHPKIPVVVDPVLGSTSGTVFSSPASVRALRELLLPRAALVTPNWPEAETLSGRPVRDRAGAECAARAILDAGCRAVLVKGGHAPGPVCADLLLQSGKAPLWFEGIRIETTNTHGTGCVLSSAIAAGLARGMRLEEAVREARGFLRRALARGKTAKLGGGRGPAFAG